MRRPPVPSTAPLPQPLRQTASSASTAFADALIAWQRQHGRHDLPWQGTHDPYRIWLSEIMLQQTQVAAVIPYYQRFLERCPDVASLAAAPRDTVMALWAGLGYYARARNLHACAQAVMAQHGGRFPDSAAVLATLPGIGRSTAAAIAAFAYGERAAILDGNVKRVLARCFGIEGFPGSAPVERTLWTLAESLLPDADMAAYTQGLMDLGATVCTRGRPACARCPFATRCEANASGRQQVLPAARPRKAVPQRRARFLIVDDGTRLWLDRRPSQGIWGGLLTLPELADADLRAAGTGGTIGDSGNTGGTPAADPAAWCAAHGLRLAECTPQPPLEHAFTHFRLTLEPLWCRVRPATVPAAHLGEPDAGAWVAWSELADAGLPTPMRRILARARGKG